MPLTLSLAQGSGWSTTANGESESVILTVSNPGLTALTVQQLTVSEVSKTGAIITQPVYLYPNAPPGTGNPVISPGASSSYVCECAFDVPVNVGPSPQTPGGAYGLTGPPTNSVVTLQAICLSSDGVVTSVQQPFAVLSTVAPFPIAQGGALQLSSGFNLINLITL